MPRLRFTLRWLMVAVAIAAIVSLQFVRSRQARFREEAARFAGQERNALDMAHRFERSVANNQEEERRTTAEFRRQKEAGLDDDMLIFRNLRASLAQTRRNLPLARQSLKDYQEAADYLAAMRLKYEQAASYPFLPLATDPAPPRVATLPFLAPAPGRRGRVSRPVEMTESDRQPASIYWKGGSKRVEFPPR